MNRCENCRHLVGVAMVCRGVMDCDPPEDYCELDLALDDEEDCERYEYFDALEDEWQEDIKYHDYLLDEWDCRNER